MVNLPSLREMANAGVHFGHRASRWHPKMEPYIFVRKNKVHVINLEKTQEQLQKALEFVAKLASENKKIVFVGSKKQAVEIVKKTALECDMPYINFRWIGGTMTNFNNIKSAIEKFKKLKNELESDEAKELNKKELSRLKKEYNRSEKIFGGLTNLSGKPDALFLISSHDEQNAVKEAKISGIPIVALVDTNSDPTLIDYPIPANDDATKSIELFANLMAKTIKENRSSVKTAEKKQ